MRKQNLINYVVNSHVRNELDINELLRLIHLLPDEPELNENQQIVLDTLKEESLGSSPFFTIWHTMENNEISSMPTKEQFQVLAAFAEWGNEE